MKIITTLVVMSGFIVTQIYAMEQGPITRSKSKRQTVSEKLCSPTKRACKSERAKPIEKVHVNPPVDATVTPVTHNQVYTPTSNKVRMRMVKSIAEAIYGQDIPPYLVQNICKDPALMCASPELFTTLCHQKFKQLIHKDLEDVGVCHADMEKKLDAADLKIRLQADKFRHLPPASRHVLAEGRQLLSELPGILVSFRKATLKADEEYAMATGSSVIINEVEVGTTTMPQEQLLWLLAHEIEHIKNKDELEYTAYELAAGQKGSKSKKFEDVHLRLSRLEEVFADIGPALRTKRLSSGYLKLMKEWCEAEGHDAGDATHPKYGEREDLAETSVIFWARHEVEQGRLDAIPS